MQNDRIKIDHNSIFKISIKAFNESFKQSMLFAWMVLWTLAGIALVVQFFLPGPENINTYLIVWLAFWLYFEYRVVYAYRWRRSGQEVLEIADGNLKLSREIAGRGIPVRYELSQIKNLRLREKDEKGFLSVMSKSYWNPGDEKLEFLYQGKEVLFGMELDKRESEKIIHLLNKKIKESRL